MTFKNTAAHFLILAGLISNSAWSQNPSPLNVVTTLPDLAEVVSAVGGDQVIVESLLKGTEDAHFVDALPSFSQKISKADMVCLVGLGLEVGWIGKVLSKSANSKIQPGGAGYCEAGKSVTPIDVPTGTVDRSMGDVHPEGNPHFYLSPLSLAESSVEVLRVLKKIRPQASAAFEERQKIFSDQMKGLHTELSSKVKLASLTKEIFTEYHKDFGYFFKAYGLKSMGSIEDKPGVPPSASRLASVAQQAKSLNVISAMCTNHSPQRHLKKFSELSGISVLRVPGGVQRDDARFDSIEKVQRFLVGEIVKLKGAQ
jgi:zinc/manganese transport system substrate-binding protein